MNAANRIWANCMIASRVHEIKPESWPRLLRANMKPTGLLFPHDFDHACGDYLDVDFRIEVLVRQLHLFHRYAARSDRHAIVRRRLQPVANDGIKLQPV